jgi:hypothetical protein
MKRILANLGWYSVVAVILAGSIVALKSSATGRIILGLGLGIIGLFVLVCIPHNLRVWRVRRVLKNLPKNVKERVLEAIARSANESPSVTFLLLDDCSPSGPETAVLSHVGGAPYAETGEEWPVQANSDPARFLLQVCLDEPRLGEQWQGRLIAVFLVFEAEQVVRSYAAPALERYVPLSAPVPPFRCVCLKSIPMPAARDEEQFPMSPAQLCDRVPEIKTLLTPFTADVSGVLSQILHPNVYAYDLAASQIAYEGGSPMLIQNPHDPECDLCRRRMRFLFQFGEIIPGRRLADAGVGYVYGCDDHPDHCKGFIDSH